ncbi:hypothetical protein [Pseudorhodoferax soli]|uniref:Uncharacterized protein n=1 Tax=Pseudorhodoferax soli TaxID=545864 RepID=A0A368XJD9_9BURK|nr:hypothetical protein DES41_108242 [Pseudorhodoferax soli]
MLTVNADNHALMKNFHKPDDEKRMVVILHDAWLDAPPERSMDFMQQYPAEMLVAVAAPIPPTAKRARPPA